MTGSVSKLFRRGEKSGGFEWLWWILLLALVTLLWCTAYNRWTPEAWGTPVEYLGDATAELAWAKAVASGEVMPIISKNPGSLGAPFVANWNDYPTMEEGIFVWWALFVRMFGLFLSANLVLLSAHLLAAASFYFVCRTLNYDRIWSLVGAVLFALSYYAFLRSLSHLVLTFYWHVPLGLLVAWWCIAGPEAVKGRKLWFGVAVAVLHGVQNPYYAGIFLQFLALAALVNVVRSRPWRVVAVPLFFILAVMVTLLVINIDTLYTRLLGEANDVAVVRDYAGLEIYALKPVELFIPAIHRWQALQTWTAESYYSRTIFHGENGSPYLGIVGIVAFGSLLWVSFRALARGQFLKVPIHFAGTGWIFLFSVVGGIGGMIGLLGLVLFRCSNRYSIVILALSLLFLVRQLSFFTRQWRWPVASLCAGLVLLVGYWDQVRYPPTKAAIHRDRQQLAADARVVAAMESKLFARAMIFQLPVVDYPEVPPVEAMRDYEHLRPYLHSKALRFSYGTHKGRIRERWQQEVMQFGVRPFAQTLERFGFSAILINKRAYRDRATSLVSELRSAGRTEILADSDDLICIRLEPVAHPTLPPEFDRSWSGLEGTEEEHWRWSSGNANFFLYNADSRPKHVRISFRIRSLQSRRLGLHYEAQQLFGTLLGADGPPERVELSVALQPGRNKFSFLTDLDGELPGNGDPRKLAFSMHNFEIVEL